MGFVYRARLTVELKRMAIRECFGLPIDSFSARMALVRASSASAGIKFVNPSCTGGQPSCSIQPTR